MRRLGLLRLSAAAGLLLLAACSKDSTSPSLIDTASLNTDVASSAGDAIALDVAALTENDSSAALVSVLAADRLGLTGTLGRDSISSWNRTRTCFDSTGTAIACIPLGPVRVIATHVEFSGSRSGTAANGATFSGVLQRMADDTLTRVFTAGVETSRIHDGVATGTDTTSFSGPNVTRTHDASGVDSIEAVTFALPRSSNPWPVSGKIVRNVTVHVTYATATVSQTRDVQRRVEVDFPADAQGNVTLLTNGLTCTLNLASHTVSGCQ